MGIEIAARASNDRISNDRRSTQRKCTTHDIYAAQRAISEFSLVASTPESTEDHVLALETEQILVVQSPVEDNAPAPSARTKLRQSR